MRIRRRAADVLRHTQAAPLSRDRSPPAPAAPSAPSRASSPSPEAATRSAVSAACEVKRSMCEAAPFEPRLPSHGQNRQGDKEGRDGATGNAKIGIKEDRRSEDGDGRPIHVACSTMAAATGQREARPTEAEEMTKSGDTGVQVKDEGKAAAFCRKGDGKGWQCKREAQGGYSLCQYHLDKLRSYGRRARRKKQPNPAAPVPEQPAAAAAAAGIHSQNASEQKKKRSMEEHAMGTRPGPSDSFYYYSGFGPQRRKRRGDTLEEGTRAFDADASQGQYRRQDMVDAAAVAAEDDDDEYDCDKPSRDGKPLKSRPLASLL